MKPRILHIILVVGALLTTKWSIGQSISENCKDSLLRLEAEISSQFLSLRPFHLGLLHETGYLDQYPIDSLTMLFNELKVNADSAIVLVRNSSTKEESTSLYVLNELLKSSVIKNIWYKSVCQRNNIIRRDADEMIEYVGKVLFQWQDSLMTQGRTLGNMKTSLDQTFDLKTQKDLYKVSYHFISEAEAIHKKCQTYLVQIENAQTRFEASNGEAVYYWGAGIQPKPEQVSLDQVVGLFLLDMLEFRQLERDFKSSLHKH